jgi:tetratricopeptide (TPR) repeat protein
MKGALRKHLIYLVLIAAIGFLAYSNTLHAPFQLDEYEQIIHNPVIRDLRNFTSEKTGYDFNPRRFVGNFTFALNYHFGHLDVVGYHIVNLFIHITNALFVYLFVLLTFRTPPMRQSADASASPGPSLIALFSALLYVAHPLQTEAVTYVVQRFTSLATFFYLLSLVMYIRGRLTIEKQDDTEGRLFSIRSLPFFLVSLIAAVCAMKTKEIAFTLPLVILLYESVFFKLPSKKKLLFLLPILLTLLIVPLSLLQSGKPMGEILSDLGKLTKVQTQMSRWAYLMTEMRVIVTYILLIFLPVNQNLDYDYPVYHSLFVPTVFFSFLFLLCILGLGIYLVVRGKRHNPFAGHYRLIGFGILWFFITLSVESSVIPIADVIFEHRLYLPLVGALTAITTGAVVAGKRLRIEKIVIPALVLVTLLLSGLTYARNTLWNDEIRLWQDVAEKSPNKARPHANLGYAYLSRGQWDKAITEFQTALRLRHSAQDHYNLGVAYGKKGLIEKAKEEYLFALSAANFAKPHNNLGVLYAKSALLDEAIKHFQIAIRLQPGYAIAHNNLGHAYQEKGLTDMAIEQYQLAAGLEPDNLAFRNDLATALQRRQREAETN